MRTRVRRRPRTPGERSRRPSPRLRVVRSALGCLAGAVVAVLIAPRCAACGTTLDRPLEGPVCPACWSSVRPLAGPLCDRCGDVLPSWRAASLLEGRCARCRRRPPAFDRARAYGPYEGALRAIIHALKYDRRRSLASPLAALARDGGRDLLEGAECVVPVPLHWRRRRARGFNQAALLASGLGLPVRHALRRARRTRPQAELPESRRHANLRGAFAPARRSSAALEVAGRVVVLVDDVCTTGATLNECARTLKRAGALEVRALTVARTVSRRR